MLRIAICDDDLNFLDYFVRMITASFADAGQQIKVFAFSDGKSLIEKVEEENQFFDVIFMDVEMPIVRGFQVAGRLRELNTDFILIFTTYIEHQSREGYLYGAFRYVFKNNLETEINEAVSGIIKAAAKVDIETFRRVELSIKRKGNILILVVENGYATTPVLENGVFVTCKKDKDHHAIGMLSIHYIAETYNGTVNNIFENNWFKSTVMLSGYQDLLSDKNLNVRTKTRTRVK